MNKTMTVDVEDFYQVGAFENDIKIDDWDNHEFRVGNNTRRILEIFEKNDVKATFFVLGWVAERDPELVKLIVEKGHELACHGYNHQKIFNQTPEEFFEDIKRSKLLLEEISGVKVNGYRAPSFSIDKRNEWAFDLIKEAGFLYSSSTYSVKHDHYGTPDWPSEPYQLKNGLWEYPQSTVDIMGRKIPVGGGGYFRLFPLFLSDFLMNKFESQNRYPYIFYFHPWEIDPEQPKIKTASFKSRFRHYVNLKRMEGKIISISKKYIWYSISSSHNIPQEKISDK